MDKNSHFKASTKQPQKLVGMVVKPNGKLKIHFIFKAYRSTAGYDFNI